MQTARFFGSVPTTIRNDDGSDELADGVVSIKRPPHANTRLRADARGRDGGVREKLAEVGLKSASMQKSIIFKRSIVFNGKKTSVNLEDAFWNALKEIAGKRAIRLSDLVAEIDERRGHGNLSSAVRLFVLDYYQRLRKNAE
jgi:predicted DNA-binding ribbon-helix-helix protein